MWWHSAIRLLSSYNVSKKSQGEFSQPTHALVEIEIRTTVKFKTVYLLLIAQIAFVSANIDVFMFVITINKQIKQDKFFEAS